MMVGVARVAARCAAKHGTRLGRLLAGVTMHATMHHAPASEVQVQASAVFRGWACEGRAWCREWFHVQSASETVSVKDTHHFVGGEASWAVAVLVLFGSGK